MPNNQAYSFRSSMSFLNRHFALLVIGALLFAGGFLVGSLRTENQLLSQGGEPSRSAGTTAAAGTAPAQPPAPAPANVSGMPELADQDHVRGADNPLVTLVEYSDFECPFCQRFHPTMNRVLAEYGDQVAWVYRHFPLSIHANAQKAAEASECVAKLGGEEAFWNFSDLYFERTTSNGTGFPLDGLADLAAEVGVDAAAVQTCLDNDEMADRVQEDVDGGARGGVTGTPGTIVVTDGGPQELIPGALPYEQVSQVIDRYL
ncbi:MAG: hypothetical protein COU69_00225 [Candidatus Pacebacteria bacterium CG10_big_fil_rev_8_21_14_0_10_56_10]|nr:MAG: hypothetical protein COU69_00225 [Candidatus Pacebacteria bacterium CG10_big_fil_rev_8_21_14_0_10_56_10]